MKKIEVSIIIVNYKVKKELFNCIDSIIKAKQKVNYEIIVVDNDEKKTIKKELLKRFKKIIYIENPVNNGYGGGNNLGAKNARGEFLFFLNPDTLLKTQSLDNLYNAIKNDKEIGIASPLLFNLKGEIYPLQGTKELTPKRAIFSLSFLSKLLPNNKIANDYWLPNWNKMEDKNVDVIPGTAFIIRKDLFKKISGFDEKFFLYFEEFDLCKRVKALGLKIKIIASSKIIHLWESSTKKRKDIKKIFSKSRFYYFKKNYGLLDAVLVSLITGLNKKIVILILTILLGIFLRFYKVDQLMIFQGDQGWFYLSAREMIVSNVIPLVGIPSSVVWLKQGALGTYFIALGLFLGKFNPVSPAILFSIIDVGTIFLIYLSGKKWFNENVGLFASLFYTTSPLILTMGRMPYHTSAVPFFATLFFLLLSNKKTKFNLFLLFWILGLLIQLELSNAILVIALFVYYFFRKFRWEKIKILYSFLGLIFGLLPFIIYDFSHKFIQTIGLPLWIINRTRLFLGITNLHNATTDKLPTALLTVKDQLAQIIFPFSLIIFYLILIHIFITLIAFKKKILKTNLLLLLIWIFIPLLGFLIHAAPGAAYFPLLFPVVCLLIGFSFAYLLKFNKTLTVLIFLIIVFLNSFNTIKESYFISTKNVVTMPPSNSVFGPTYLFNDEVALAIVRDAGERQFSFIGKGSIGIYPSAIDGFRYLILYRGGVINQNNNLTYIIYASEDVKNGKFDLSKNTTFLFKNNYFYVFKELKK